MAVELRASWKKHAFPEDNPARDAVWAESAERRREETRLERYLEQTTDLRINRHVSKEQRDRANGGTAKDKALESLMLLAVGSPQYQAAYNHRLTFTINGEDIEIAQGELHDRARKRAEDLRRQIDDVKRKGADADALTRLQDNLRDAILVGDLTDPAKGKIPDNRHEELQDVLKRTPGLLGGTAPLGNDAALGQDVTNQKTQAADTSSSMDQDAAENATIEGWSQAGGRTSFAASIDTADPQKPNSLFAASFVQAAENTPPAEPSGEDQHPSVTPNRTTGLDV